MKITFIFTMAALPLFSQFAAANPDQLGEASNHIRTLVPEQVKALPKDVQAKLKAEGCRLPDPSGRIDFGPNAAASGTTVTGEPWVSGRFGSQGEPGWAAICLANHQSKVVVFWEGKATCPALVADPVDVQAYVYGGQTLKGDFYYFAQALEKKPGPGAHQETLVENGDKGSIEYHCEGNHWSKFVPEFD